MQLYPESNEPITIKLDKFATPPSTKYDPVRELASGLKKMSADLLGAVVYSSVATGDIIAHWSDLDVMVIVKDAALQDEGRFKKFRLAALDLEKFLYQFDPHQHHGIQFITQADLNFYPETFLPISTIALGKSLLGSLELNFFRRDSRPEQIAYFYNLRALLARAAAEGELPHHGKNGVYLQNNFERAADNFYQLKYFVSLVLLLPSLFIGLVDKPIYKRESFTKIKEYFSAEELELVTCCEAVRSLFTGIRVKANAVPEEVKSVLGEKYFERARRLINTMIKVYERN